MTKKSEKNLQDKKKSIIFAPGLENVILEKVSKEPCENWKPKEAMSIREMLIRSERGQRIDVKTRFRAEGIPDNMYFREYEEVRLPDGTIEKRPKPDLQEDTFAHTPPGDVNDIVDVIRLQEETNDRKAELQRKRTKQQEEENHNRSQPHTPEEPVKPVKKKEDEAAEQ